MDFILVWKITRSNFISASNLLNTIGDEARNKNVSPADTNCCLTGMSFAAELKSKKAFEKQGETSSARAEISDGPHKGGLRRAGPNDFMFVYNLVQRDLSISMFFVFIFLFCYSCFLFFCNLSTIHNLATYTL